MQSEKQMSNMEKEDPKDNVEEDDDESDDW